ncbi:uncharacterized protein LOC110637569 [Hevea brasiliensis]|uniref:uncharacterized protein LOC110637569 n=1 Tax=Hevea brasiliensis TaxID=3981 RepID=UPI0025F8CD5F|nr:uncharacterized protein LOC110637569 [Hevea brasiliensis]
MDEERLFTLVLLPGSKLQASGDIFRHCWISLWHLPIGFATITFAFLSQHHDNPIKLSVWPIIFAFGVLCSRFPRNPRTRVDSMIVERILLIANFVVELPPAVFDQLSLVHKPQYALVIMLMSLATMLFSIIDLARKGRRDRVEWMMRGYLPWFCSPRRNYKHLVTFSDIVGLVCGIFQLVFATINYAFLSQHYDNPIKLSVWPIIFAFGVLCSRFPRNRVDSISKQNFDPVPILPSRAPILKEIMDSLRDPNINILGVCGMGGVGKTTLVKEVVRQAQLEYLFDDVIFVTVSETPKIRGIQADVAEFLSLRLHEEEIFLRANRLRERLKKEKRILIILDDIWTTLQLEEVGIPFGADCKGCKILLTSRGRDVCHGMGAQKVFPLEVLSKEEALNLFEITASVSEEPYLRRIATEIVEKCAGLPLAIVKAGRSLRNKRPNVWVDKLKELRTYGEEMEEMVPLVSSLRRQQFARSELSLRGASPTQGTSSMGGETQGT